MVLSRDILAKAESDRIADAKVDVTIVGGRLVYERKGERAAHRDAGR